MNFERCGEQTSMYCLKCELFICDSCEQSHSSNIFSRNHKRENQQNQQQQEGRRNQQQHENDEGLESLKKKHCLTHPSENLSGFCFECSLFVCLECVLGVHNEHQQNVYLVRRECFEKEE